MFRYAILPFHKLHMPESNEATTKVEHKIVLKS